MMTRVLLALSLCANFACQGTSNEFQSQQSKHPLQVTKGHFQPKFLMSGYLESPDSILIASPSHTWSYTITWLIPDGTIVHKGDILAEMDKTVVQSEIKALEDNVLSSKNQLITQSNSAAMNLAEKKHEQEDARLKLAKAKLSASVPIDASPRRVYEDMQYALQQAETALLAAKLAVKSEKKLGRIAIARSKVSLKKDQSKLEFTRTTLDSYTLRAPQEGLIDIGRTHNNNQKLKVGDKVFAGNTIVTFPDLSSISVQANLEDIDDGRIHVGMKANIILDAYPDRVFISTVQHISPMATPPQDSSLRRVFQVTLQVEKSAPDIMRPGMAVRVEILGQKKENVTLIPRTAIHFLASGPLVYLLSGESRSIELGACMPQTCILLSGLTEGTRLKTKELH